MDALRCPPGDADVDQALGRRAAPRGALPAAAPAARPAAARRADQPPRRRVGGLAGALPRRSTPAPSWPSPTTATSSTTWPAGSSSSTAATASRARATTPPGWSRSRSAWRRRRRQEQARQRTLAARAGMGAARARSARQAKSKARLTAYEELLAAERASRRSSTAQIVIPPGPRLGDLVIEAEASAQGLRRPPADRGPRLSACRPAASSASSARTAPARPRCSA